MRNFILKQYIAAVALIALSCGMAQAKEVINVGAEFAMAPFSYMDGERPIGFEIDLMNEIAKINDWEIRDVKLNWEDLVPFLEAGKIDLIMSSFFKNPKREETYTLTVPYLVDHDAVMFINPDIQVASNEDLHQLKIAGIEASAQGKALFAMNFPKENFIPVKTVFLAFKAMATAKADAAISHERVLKSMSKNYPGAFKLYVIKDHPPREIVALAKKGNQALVDKFNQALEQVKANGTYAKLEKKWGID